MANVSWNTPREVLDRVDLIGPIYIDPCSNNGSVVNAKETYDLNNNQDGLILPWSLEGLTFCNPPFTTIGLRSFGNKILKESKSGCEIVVLIPADLATQIWHSTWFKANQICFPNHRIVYHLAGIKQGSPRFSSAILYYGSNTKAFEDAFQVFGKIVKP